MSSRGYFSPRWGRRLSSEGFLLSFTQQSPTFPKGLGIIAACQANKATPVRPEWDALMP